MGFVFLFLTYFAQYDHLYLHMKGQFLYEVPRVVKFLETESRLPGAGRRGGNEELLFNGYRISVLEDLKKVPEMTSGDGCIAM